MKRKYLGIVLIILLVIFMVYGVVLLTSSTFKASNLITFIAVGAITFHWFGTWVLMKYSNMNNNALNLTGQLFNLGVGILMFMLLITGVNIEQYWNWMLSLGILGIGFVLVFLAGAFETQFRLLPWIANFITSAWVVFGIFTFLQKSNSSLVYDLLFYGWIAIIVTTSLAVVTAHKSVD